MRFGDFVGNATVLKQLAAEIDAGHFPHALLLEGAAGTGRRTLARQIARAALCRETDFGVRLKAGEHPCGVIVVKQLAAELQV